MKLKWVKMYQYVTISGKNITSLSVDDKTYTKGLSLDLDGVLIRVAHGTEEIFIPLMNVQSFARIEESTPKKTK